MTKKLFKTVPLEDAQHNDFLLCFLEWPGSKGASGRCKNTAEATHSDSERFLEKQQSTCEAPTGGLMLQNTNKTHDSLILGASLSVLETQKTPENTCFGDRRECKRTVLVGKYYENENKNKGPRGTPTSMVTTAVLQ